MAPGALERRVTRACPVRKWHRYASPKVHGVLRRPNQFHLIITSRKGGYLLTRFHHTQHSANKQTLRARAAVGKMWSPAHRGSDWSPGYSVMLPFTSTSSLLLVFSLSPRLRTADPNALCSPGWSVVKTAETGLFIWTGKNKAFNFSPKHFFLTNACLTHARADSSTFHSIHSTIRQKKLVFISSPSIGLLCKNSVNAAWDPYQKLDVMKACCCLLISTNKRFI